MKRKAVKSSAITSIGYRRILRMLEIRFRSGRVYQYWDIHPNTYNALMKAKSKGSFFMTKIKDNYPFFKIK